VIKADKYTPIRVQGYIPVTQANHSLWYSLILRDSFDFSAHPLEPLLQYFPTTEISVKFDTAGRRAI
jgi:hypothetical protein